MRMDPLKETSSMNMAQRKPPMAVMTESSDRESVSSYENDDDNYTNNSNGCDDETNLTSEVDTEAEDTRAMFMKARMMMSDPVTMMRARNEKPVPSSTTQGSFTNGRSPAARNNALGQVAPQQYQQQQQRQQQPKQAPAEADRTNDMVYKALMEHKKAEMQRMKTLASDTRTITEAMLRKQVEAERTKLAVSACTRYATNAKYVEVNSGKHPNIRVYAGMHPLSPDEVDVYASLVESCPSAQVTVMHNHCMSEQGMIEGFRFTMNAKENNQYLPINRRMFFRHSMVECLPSNPAANVMGSCESPLTTSAQEDRTILELLLRQNEVKDKLVSIMQRLHKESQNGKDADFDCMPMNMDVLDPSDASRELQGGGSRNSASMAASFHARRTADCKMWNPDMPEILGLYHAYVRGYNKDTR